MNHQSTSLTSDVILLKHFMLPGFIGAFQSSVLLHPLQETRVSGEFCAQSGAVQSGQGAQGFWGPGERTTGVERPSTLSAGMWI